MILYITWHEWYKEWLLHFNINPDWSETIYNISILFITLFMAYFLFKLGKWLIRKIADFLNRENKSQIIEALDNNKFFSYLSYNIPLFIFKYNLSIILPRRLELIAAMEKIYQLAVVFLFIMTVTSLLNSIVDLHQYKKENRSKPIKGMIQFAQIILWFFGAIVCVSILFSKSPSTVIGGLGAASAILMLIFRDSITGLVAGVQLSFNKMVEIGDWVSLPKYDVDGEVIDITITSVKVKNWDKSISTVPSYNLVVTDSLKNWREMSKGGARRISRNINIDMLSIQISTPEMIEKFKKDLEDKDAVQDAEKPEYITNLTIFRAYIYHYLKNNKHINPNLEIIVRQKQSTETGLPLEIYCFTNTSSWKPYEDIQSGIFEYIFAILPSFGLKVFQSRTNDNQ